MVSPINGQVRMLRNVYVYTGTREVFHPDAVLFAQRVRATGIHTELVVGSGLNANYPLYPIPEGQRAIEQISTAISTD
jgi:acetyl esterase/lipase